MGRMREWAEDHMPREWWNFRREPDANELLQKDPEFEKWLNNLEDESEISSEKHSRL